MRDTTSKAILMCLIMATINLVVFPSLKITQVIDWPVWVVFLPVMIPATCASLVMSVSGFILAGKPDGEIK